MNRMTGIKKCAAVCLTAIVAAAGLPSAPRAAAAGQTLTVGKNGTYKTVMAAVNAAANIKPSGEGSRVTIAIEPGTYREQVIVNTPYLSFVNSNPGGGEVLLTWYYGIGYKYYSSASTGYYNASDASAKSAKGIAQRWGTAVRLQSGAKYFRAENITFENSFNRYMTTEEVNDGVEATGETLTVQRKAGLDVTAKTATERAAAMCVEADYCEFYKCSFLSSQDTLYTANPAYFKACKIQGNTDYIFGSGDVVFDECELCFGGYSDKAVGGYITAAREQSKGYLFWNCNVTANSALKAAAGYFGRPWRDTAHVLFYNTKLQYEGIITPVGWTSMSGVDPSQATFREYNTTTVSGAKVNTGSRTSGTVLSSCSATREQYLGSWTPYYFNFAGSTAKAGAVLSTSDLYYLRNVNSGLYLSVEGNVAAAGSNVVQAQKADATAWAVRPGTDGYYYIYAQIGDGSYLLDLDYGKPDNGTNIGIYSDTSSDAQLFKFVSMGSGNYQIVTKVTEDASCIGVTGSSKDAGANVIEWECTDASDQLWTLETKIPEINGSLIRSLLVYDREHAASWSIVPSAQDGTVIFGDRDVTLSGLPEALRGAEMIRTACDSKIYAGDEAEFTAAADATVYVALDSRVPQPGWLGSWTKTDMTYQNSINDVTFIVYEKTASAGEQIVLGMNWDTSKCVNYSVFVKEIQYIETTTAAPETTTTTVTTVTQPEESMLRGDVDCSGKVNIADAILLAQYCAEISGTVVSPQGLLNAELDGVTGLSSDDIGVLLQALAGLGEL